MTPQPFLSPEEALERLMAGNARYASGTPQRPNQDAARRTEVAGGQSPFAVVVGCSDSRVPVEVVFDQGLGDLFVVRTAGNLIDDVGAASIEFAVSALGARLVMVMGHQRCGAVKATVDATLARERESPAAAPASPASPPNLLNALVTRIQPAVDTVRDMEGDMLENAIRANAQGMAHHLQSRSLVIQDAIQQGNIRIVSSVYDLDTGRVELVQ